MPTMELRHDWSRQEIRDIYRMRLLTLLFEAKTCPRRYFATGDVQLCQLLSIKTGACPEDCAYCPQSAHYNTGLEREALMDAKAVRAAARRAKDAGATRFCMGAAWRSPTDRDLAKVCDMVREVKALGLETCCTLGMLT